MSDCHFKPGFVSQTRRSKVSKLDADQTGGEGDEATGFKMAVAH
jgi:hypothetical protein